MRRAAAENAESAEYLRDFEVMRLDRALVEITNVAYDRSLAPERRLNALEALRRNVESRARLLGLHAPERVEMITVGALELRVRELSNQLGMPIPAELI